MIIMCTCTIVLKIIFFLSKVLPQIAFTSVFCWAMLALESLVGTKIKEPAELWSQ